MKKLAMVSAVVASLAATAFVGVTHVNAAPTAGCVNLVVHVDINGTVVDRTIHECA